MSNTASITIDAPELKVIEPTKAESIKAIFEPLSDLNSLKGKYEFKSKKHREAFKRVQGHLDTAIAEISQ